MLVLLDEWSSTRCCESKLTSLTDFLSQFPYNSYLFPKTELWILFKALVLNDINLNYQFVVVQLFNVQYSRYSEMFWNYAEHKRWEVMNITNMYQLLEGESSCWPYFKQSAVLLSPKSNFEILPFYAGIWNTQSFLPVLLCHKIKYW